MASLPPNRSKCIKEMTKFLPLQRTMIPVFNRICEGDIRSPKLAYSTIWSPTSPAAHPSLQNSQTLPISSTIRKSTSHFSFRAILSRIFSKVRDVLSRICLSWCPFPKSGLLHTTPHDATGHQNNAHWAVESHGS